MQLKGLVKFFTIALILISLYQLSLTFAAQSKDKQAMAKAKRAVQAQYPAAQGDSLSRLTDLAYSRITDSLQGEKVFSLGFKQFTYQELKSQELNLGLDLQGGMNVTLDVSLDELIRSMSNSPQDPGLNKSLEEAHRRKQTSTADFVTLFGQSYASVNPNAKMALLFTKPSEKEITYNSSNDQVIAKIRRESNDAVQRTYNVLKTRIDKFGVSQPNINLDASKGIITVELAGVKNPERVREYLQSTAKLQFFETYTNEEIYPGLDQANKALAAYLGGASATDTAKKAADTTATASAAGADTVGDLKNLIGKSGAKASANDTSRLSKDMKENPLYMVWYPFTDNKRQLAPGPRVGLVAKKDTAKLREYLALDAVRSKFPPNVQFVYGAESNDDRANPNIPLILYAVKLAPGGGAELEGDRITTASMDYNQLNGRPEVRLDMDMAGAQIWRNMTARNKGKYVAVTMDDRVYTCPIVENEIGNGSTSISGGFSAEEATQLANILKSGKLPAPAHIVQEQVVGPTLGAENIAAGKVSLMIAFAVIFLLMLAYYNTAGIVADIALILNLFFTFAILAMFGATLTMPGIAGLVLTIGMAVDTNVIVFERIKEELAAGLSYTDAIRKGYSRSYAPVLDGHITQFLTALILFLFGLGPVKGFATTQMIGLILSVFCGLLVSRLITDMYTQRNRHFKYFTGLSKSIFRKAHFRFIEVRKYTYIISGIVFLAGIGSFFYGYDYGVEFAGGRSYDVRFDRKIETNDLRDKMKSYLGEYPIVKTIGTDNTLNITTTYLISEQDKAANEKVQRQLYKGLKDGGFVSAPTFENFYATNVKSEQTVLPTISADLKKGAIWATVLSLAAIFLYILGRFRKWQYSLGTIIALLHDVSITLAVFSFLRGRVPFALEIDQHFIAAVLTVIGFSMNDTVIVFDRVREYFRKSVNESRESVINRAINDTLSRTIMTSLTVFLTVLILFIFGGEVTRGFAFAMLIGVVTGTYSSIFVAAPVLVDMDKSDSLKNEIDTEARIEELKKMA